MNFVLIILLILAAIGILMILSNAFAPNSALAGFFTRIANPGSPLYSIIIFLSGVSSAMLLHYYAPSVHRKIIGPDRNGNGNGKRLIDTY